MSMNSLTILDASGIPKSLLLGSNIDLHSRRISITFDLRSMRPDINGLMSGNRLFACSTVKNFAGKGGLQTKRDVHSNRRPEINDRNWINYQQLPQPPPPLYPESLLAAPVLLDVLNEWPQPQEETAFGLSIRKPPPIKLSS